MDPKLTSFLSDFTCCEKPSRSLSWEIGSLSCPFLWCLFSHCFRRRLYRKTGKWLMKSGRPSENFAVTNFSCNSNMILDKGLSTLRWFEKGERRKVGHVIGSSYWLTDFTDVTKLLVRFWCQRTSQWSSCRPRSHGIVPYDCRNVEIQY